MPPALAVLASRRITARMKRVQEHSTPVNAIRVVSIPAQRGASGLLDVRCAGHALRLRPLDCERFTIAIWHVFCASQVRSRSRIGHFENPNDRGTSKCVSR